MLDMCFMKKKKVLPGRVMNKFFINIDLLRLSLL